MQEVKVKVGNRWLKGYIIAEVEQNAEVMLHKQRIIIGHESVVRLKGKWEV